jgi:hypothetical protein
MMNASTRYVPALPTHQLGPNSEVGVVTVSEEILIKAAQLRQEPPPVQSRTAIRKQRLRLSIELTQVLFARPSAPILAVQKDLVACLVDQSSIVKKDFGSAHAVFLAAAKGENQLFQPFPVRNRIVVQQGNQFPSSRLNPGVCPTREAPVLGQLEKPNTGVLPAIDQLDTAISRAIVHHKNLKVSIRLPGDRVQALPKQVRAIVVDYNYGDQG